MESSNLTDVIKINDLNMINYKFYTTFDHVKILKYLTPFWTK
jgi:hypothetical protein